MTITVSLCFLLIVALVVGAVLLHRRLSLKMRPFQNWDCGNASCPIKSDEGKRLERVIVWTQESLETVRLLVDSKKLQSIRFKADHKDIVVGLIAALEAAHKDPYDQSLHERVWEVGDKLVKLLPEQDQLPLLPWIPPFSNSIPEMAFCRVVDGWKDYIEKRTGYAYGQHRKKLTSGHQCCDDCLKALRNLFVHSTGFLESDSKGNKRYDKFARLMKEASAFASTTNPILKIPGRVCALNNGDIVMLNILEVEQYIEGLKELLFALE